MTSILIAGVFALAPMPEVGAQSAPTVGAIPWASYPTADQIASMYPARALLNRVEGSGTTDCTINSAGRFISCDLVDQSPAGSGFYMATVKLLMKYAIVDTTHFQGSRVRVTMNFMLPPASASASSR